MLNICIFLFVLYYYSCYNQLISGDICISDVIFPNNLPRNKVFEDMNKTELYKISHHAYEIGERLNRK